jgi:hypothetical protein
MLSPAEREKTKELLSKESADIQCESFALKILLQQQKVRYNLNKNEKTLEEAVNKVDEFFEKMKGLDTVRRDFKKIYGRELNV